MLEMDGQFDKLEELIYVESHLSNTSAKFYGAARAHTRARSLPFLLAGRPSSNSPAPLAAAGFDAPHSHRSFASPARPAGEITQQMLKNSSFPGSNNGTGLLQTMIGLKVRWQPCLL